LRAAKEFEDSSQADDLDRLLSQMPGEPPPGDLAARICHQVGVRRRRDLRVRLGISLLLTVFGVWMALPGLINSLQDLNLPSSGVSYLFPFIQSILNGLWGFMQNAVDSLTTFQANLAKTMGAGARLGIVALAGAALLALNLVMPQIEE
jgi:hypothetical protein